MLPSVFLHVKMRVELVNATSTGGQKGSVKQISLIDMIMVYVLCAFLEGGLLVNFGM